MKDKTQQRLNEVQVRKAVAALLKHIENDKLRQKNKQLLDEDETLHMLVALKKTPAKKSNKPIRIDIPNPIYAADDSEICLLVKDTNGKGHKEAKERVKQIENCGVQKVIGVQKLKSNYYPFEAKRKLCDSYDLFLADDRILPLLPKLLGKAFFKKKKQPVPVPLGAGKNWAQQIRRALGATYTFLSGGSCVSVRAARSCMDEAAIVDNVLAAAQNTALQVPQKWANIQAIYLKTNESVALPIYSSTPALMKLPDQIKSTNATEKAEATLGLGVANSDDGDDEDEEDEEDEEEPPKPVPNPKPKAKAATPAAKTPAAKTPAAKATPAGKATPGGKGKPTPKTAMKSPKSTIKTPGSIKKRNA